MTRQTRTIMLAGLALAALPAPVLAQAIGSGFGALASIAPADFHPAGKTDSIAPMSLQNPGAAPGMPETSVRLSTGSSRAVIQVNDNRVLTYNYNTLVNAGNGAEPAGVSLRAGGVVIPSAATGSAVIVSLVAN